MATSDNLPMRQRVTTRAQLLQTISARRRILKLSQKQLADKLGIHQSHLSDIETGRKTLNVDRLLELCNLLGLDLIVQNKTPEPESEW
jgi:transcriptional regulator with XRE-family HTH domain